MSLTRSEVVELGEVQAVVLGLALDLLWGATRRFRGSVGVGISKGPSHIV